MSVGRSTHPQPGQIFGRGNDRIRLGIAAEPLRNECANRRSPLPHASRHFPPVHQEVGNSTLPDRAI
jgi:hypothetical protein